MKHFTHLEGIKKVLYLDLVGNRGIKSKDQDRVSVITGYEGRGKSSLALHMFEYWYSLLNIHIEEQLLHFFSDNQKGFVTALNNAPKYYMVVHDEAGKDLYTRNAMSTFTKDLNVAYQVIRGSNLHTILILPHILDLESFFRKRRVTQMFYVYKTGKVAYYTKKRLRQIMPNLLKSAQNSEDPDPLSCGSPLFLDTFPKYTGVFLEQYAKNKSKNIEEIKNYLFDKYVNENKQTPQHFQNDEENSEIKTKLQLEYLKKKLLIYK
jgi:hypothetical protein